MVQKFKVLPDGTVHELDEKSNKWIYLYRASEVLKYYKNKDVFVITNLGNTYLYCLWDDRRKLHEILTYEDLKGYFTTIDAGWLYYLKSMPTEIVL